MMLTTASVGKKETPYFKECIQCGMCCIVTLCQFGKNNKNGFCKYLKKNDEEGLTTYCTLVRDRVIPGPLDHFVGSGCMLRTCEEVYKLYIQHYADSIAHFLKKEEYNEKT